MGLLMGGFLEIVQRCCHFTGFPVLVTIVVIFVRNPITNLYVRRIRYKNRC
jgi:hypothetical protein